MNFGEHRAGVITTFDSRTVKMLHPKTPTSYDNRKGLVNQTSSLADELPMTPTRTKYVKKIASGDKIVGQGVEHIDILLKESRNGGLDYIFQTCKQDPHLGPLTNRATFVRWLAARTPTFIRAMEHFDEFIRGQKLPCHLRLGNPWVQT